MYCDHKVAISYGMLYPLINFLGQLVPMIRQLSEANMDLCVFCRNNNETFDMYTSHKVRLMLVFCKFLLSACAILLLCVLRHGALGSLPEARGWTGRGVNARFIACWCAGTEVLDSACADRVSSPGRLLCKRALTQPGLLPLALQS